MSTSNTDTDTSTDTGRTRTENPFGYASVPGTSYEDFGTMHGIHAEFLPFNYRTFDPIELLVNLGTCLRNRPPTRQRISLKELKELTPITFSQPIRALLDEYMLVLGWWRGGSTSTGPYYCNPEYVHSHGEDTITDPNERRRVLRQAGGYGHCARTLAPVFGLSGSGDQATKAVWSVISRLDIPWSDLRHAGVQRLARTWKTITAWDYSHREIGIAFDYPRRTVTEWINREPEDFSPPTDPTVGFVRGDR